VIVSGRFRHRLRPRRLLTALRQKTATLVDLGLALGIATDGAPGPSDTLLAFRL
jgi:hypothetical protein